MSLEASVPHSFLACLVSGGIAGMAVDISLYPLDTIKTRLQSSQGFLNAGGFRGVYAGLGVAALGSAPGAALFFSSYESAKRIFPSFYQNVTGTIVLDHVNHMFSASISEVVACLVRVPTEVVKQRYQAKLFSNSLLVNISKLYKDEGIFGFYRGFGSTIMREIPFSLIQFPLYEFMKKQISESVLDGRALRPYEAALCGSLSGGIAAAFTTPLDVIKTRLMLGKDRNGTNYEGFLDAVKKLSKEANDLHSGRKWKVFFAGIEPRVMWISIGGFVFFGAYEQALQITSNIIL